MHIFITGGSGPTGASVVAELIARSALYGAGESAITFEIIAHPIGHAQPHFAPPSAEPVAQAIVILGEDEVRDGVATVKVFAMGEQVKVGVGELVERLRGSGVLG